MLLKTKKRATSGTVVSATAHVIAEQYGGTEHRVIASLNDSQAVIHFHPDGTIISANDNFLAALGYTHAEIVGQHHRIFVDPVEAASKAYLDFWSDLASGIFHTAEYRRIAKGGRDVWIQATYNPVYDEHGQVDRVVKFATDITRQRMSQQEIRDRTQAVIEFEPDGTIITANELFTGTVGYRLEELKGQHHRMFMPPGHADTIEYKQFWPSLARGEFLQGEFHRVDAHGRDLWLRGAYNPVIGSDGEVVKIVKGVANITDEVLARQEASRVGDQIATAVSEFSGAIQQISGTVSRTAALAGEAESGVSQASDHIGTLQATSDQIGSVIDIIKGLSGQTNTLALNATIEAARAGEAGRGFAVVANQVKELAGQTNLSADDIGRIIEAIQTEIKAAVVSVEAISTSVGEVSDMTATVAAAVEEQSALMGQLDAAAGELLRLSR